MCPPMVAEILMRNVALWQPTDFGDDASSKEDVDDDLTVWMAVIVDCIDKDGAPPTVPKSVMLQFRSTCD